MGNIYIIKQIGWGLHFIIVRAGHYMYNEKKCSCAFADCVIIRLKFY